MPPTGPSAEPLRKNLTIMAGLVVVGLMAFGLTLSFYRNLLFEQTLQELERRNGLLLKEIEQGYRDLEYFGSTQFKDKFAKEKLGRVNPGENTLLILRTPETSTGGKGVPSSEERQQALYEEFLQQTPVIEHWMLYLFHREKLKNMRGK
ncbi:hypothetical protein HY464_01900 [Candidatus Peregrinibacteria bacterium]|nr:hypothetical protein [Candidatus Peregrinibacteria bacterium]MBI2524234.1 hypothetical protein [Candidatus Peregrinibacteria bacterium]MBI4129424.1 hypothetical protein [Candidatus Peregrinibacteria bacterium]